MLKTCLTTKEDIADALIEIGFRPSSSDFYTFAGIGKYKDLYARTLQLDNGGFEINFGYKPTFDRWANSTNFILVIDAEHLQADFETAADHAIKICEANVFDFQSYFYPIYLK